MASVEEIAKLTVIMEALGFDKASAEIASLDKMMAQAKDDLAAAAQREAMAIAHEIEMMAHEQRQIEAVIAAENAEVDAIGRQAAAHLKSADAAEKTAKGNAKAAGSSRDVGRGFLEMSRAVEDAQYGLAGVLNNIPNMVQMFGGPAGLAAAISLVAVGINVLLPRLKELWDNLKSEAPREIATELENVSKRLDELKDKKIKLAVDHHEIDILEEQMKRLKAAKAEFEAKMSKQTADEAQAGKEADEAFNEAGAPELEAKLKAKFIKENLAKSAEFQKARADQAESEEYLKTAPGEEINETKEMIKRAQERARRARQVVEEAAETHVGGLTKGTREGTGVEQAAHRENLAKELESVGEKDLAKKIRESTAAAAKWWREAEEDAKAVAAFVEADKKAEKEIFDKRKEVQEEGLHELIKSKELDGTNDKIAKQVNDKGLTHLQSFQELKDQIQAEITERLRQSGIDLTKAEDMIAKAAEQEAEQAFARVGREGQRAAKAEGRSQTKEQKEREQAQKEVAKAGADKAMEVFKAGEAREKAEAHRVIDAAGKGIVEEFKQAAARSFLPIEEAAKVLVGQLAQRFQNAGARPGAANLAARTIAAGAGFVVAPPRPFVGPPRPAANTAAGRRISAAEKKLAFEQAKQRKKILEAQRKKNAAAARNKNKRGNQASVIPAVQGTQQAVAATQAAVAAEQARVAKLEANVQQLLRDASRLRNRASEQAPTASNTGSSVA
jgi:hypothetical protein